MNPLHPSPPRAAVVVLALLLGTAAHASMQSPAAPPASTIFHACPDALAHSSTSVIDNDGKRTVTVKLDGGRCSIDFRLEGRAGFNDDFTDLVSLSRGGSLHLDVKDDGERHQLEIEPGRDGLARTWKVNGRQQEYDGAARAWFAAFLVDLDRRTAVGVEQRLPVLLRKGGVAAVLDETGRMPSDYARGVYYAKLAEVRPLSSADVARVLDQAATLKTGDYYASELMKSLGARAGDDADVRSAMFRLIQAMDGDYYRAEAVKQAVGKGGLGSGEMDFLVGVLPKMGSDYYKAEVLKSILASGSIDAAHRAQLAALAKDIHEDAYAFEFVKGLAKGDLGPGGVRALIDATSTIQSDFYLSESVAAILSGPPLKEGDLLSIVKAARSCPSEYYRSQMLRKVLAHRAVTKGVRDAVLEATGGMSAYYREEVAKAGARR